MLRKLMVILLVSQLALAGCLNFQGSPEQNSTQTTSQTHTSATETTSTPEHSPPLLTVEAAQRISLNVSIRPFDGNGSARNDRYQLEGGDETTVGSDLKRQPYTFVLEVNGQMWERTIESGQHLTVRAYGDGNIAVTSNIVE